MYAFSVNGKQRAVSITRRTLPIRCGCIENGTCSGRHRSLKKNQSLDTFLLLGLSIGTWFYKCQMKIQLILWNYFSYIGIFKTIEKCHWNKLVVSKHQTSSWKTDTSDAQRTRKESVKYLRVHVWHVTPEVFLAPIMHLSSRYEATALMMLVTLFHNANDVVDAFCGCS